MQDFLSALAHAFERVDFAVANAFHPDAYEEAEAAMEDLRTSYKRLASDEKDAGKPLAALLSGRLDAYHQNHQAARVQDPSPASRARAGPEGAPARASSDSVRASATEELFNTAMTASSPSPAGPAAKPSAASESMEALFNAAMAEGVNASDPSKASPFGEEGVREILALDFAPMAPTRIFTGEPTPEALLAHFGYDSFRSGQAEAVQAALSRHDTLVVMPTGGGKSLCYQLPGMASAQLTVVVTPLVALMRDQYQRLVRDGHPAVMLASGLGEGHNQEALDQVRDGSARMVFCSPERFASHSFNDALASREIGLFVVDEAHCVSEWGHDFRPDYLRLHKALEAFGRPPVMACTATATPKVAAEIVGRLGLRDPLHVHGGFDRPNLSFDVVALAGEGAVARKRGLLQEGLHMAANRPAIVYAGTRKDVESVTADLSAAGLSAVGYHAGMPSEQREHAQASFMTGAADIVVATNAFGMGVDKADVRSVWHWALPTSVEGYYQEAGRAGRDGESARAVLLAMRADLGRLISFNKRRSTTVEAVQAYLTRLRRAAKRDEVLIDQPENDEDRIALAIAERAGALTINPAIGGKLAITLSGTLNARRAQACCDTAKKRGWDAYRAVERFSSSRTCRRAQLLAHFGDERPPQPTGRCCDVCDPTDWLPDPESVQPIASATAKKTAASKKTAKASSGKKGKASGKASGTPSRASTQSAKASGPPAGGALGEALREWRKRACGQAPVYTVAKNATLDDIARIKPMTLDELHAISGVGPTFLTKHGPLVLELVAQHRE